MQSSKNKALFLDRDGVINIDYGYVHDVKDCQFVDGIFDLCVAAKEKNYKLIVVTNQAGIAKGFYTLKDFWLFMDYIKQEFSSRGCPLDDIFFCPYHKDGLPPWNQDSQDRKPQPGMILKAAEKHALSLADSILIGDKESDILAGLNAGIGKNILINGKIIPEHIL